MYASRMDSFSIASILARDSHQGRVREPANQIGGSHGTAQGARGLHVQNPTHRLDPGSKLTVGQAPLHY